MPTITKQDNTATVVFDSPDSRTAFYTLIKDFLTGTGEYANTTATKLLVTVKGRNPTVASQPDFGTGTDADPYVYFKFDTPASTTRKATVVIDWSGINLTINYSTGLMADKVFTFMLHDLAAVSAIHHINLNIANNSKKGQTCYVSGAGSVTFENSAIYGGVTVEGDNYAAFVHNGTGTVQFLNTKVEGAVCSKSVLNTGSGTISFNNSAVRCKGESGHAIQNLSTGTIEAVNTEIAYYKANRGVYNKAGGEVALTGCTFVEDTDVDYYQGQSVYNESGLVNLEGCTVLAVTNQDRAELCNCRIKGGFENESYARLTHCDLSDTFHAKSGRAFFDNCRIFISEARSNFIAGIYVESAEASVHLSNSDIEVYNQGGSATAGAYGIFIYNMSNAVNYRDIYAQNCVITAGRASNSTAKSIGITDFNNFASSNYIRITLLGCKFPEPNWGVLGDNVSVGFPDEETTPRHPVMHVQGCKFSKAGIAIGSQYYTESTQATTYLPTGANLFNVVL